MKKGYLTNKYGGIPKGWKERLMPEVSFFQEGPGLRTWQFKHEGIKVINITNMVNGVLDLSRTTRHISWEEFNSTYTHFECQENDIVIASSGNSYCKHAIVRKQDLPLVMNTSVIRFQPLTEIAYNFLNQFLKSSLFKEQIDFMITGGAQPNFGPIHLNKVVLALPPLPEQQKIAEILSTVDAKIEIIDQQISETQDLKKGLMQQLLTKGIGHAEFKDSALGKIPKSWEVVKISKVAHINNSSLPNTTDEKYEFYYIDLSSVKSGKIETPLEKIKYSDSPSRARRILKRGDVIMATVRPNLLGFAFAGFDTNNYVCSTGFALLSHKENSNGQFIYQNLYSESVKYQINKLIVGSNYPAINSSDVKNIRIPFPSLNEQNQIAEILTSVDDKLEVLSEKKTTYKELKQGLMQQLLTGRVRV
jgi:type I restriction enzyme S subunit